jgi:hypothetical protein
MLLRNKYTPLSTLGLVLLFNSSAFQPWQGDF